MKSYWTFFIGIVSILILLASLSCSKQDGIENSSTMPNSQLIPEIRSIENPGNHSAVAYYDAEIDPDAGTFTITQSRTAEYHFPLNNLYPSVLRVTAYGFTPNFWADIQLRHPYPNSGIDGFDARVIAVLPANPGVSTIYPEMNISGNNAVVLYPDGYTNLFDRSDFVGNVNPFMAYFAWTPNRVWSSTGYTSETMRWDLDINGFGGPLRFALIVDISTNYPAPPQPGIDNAQEPVRITANIGSGMTSAGGSAQIDVTLLDWQGSERIGGVVVESPHLFSGVRWLTYLSPGPNPNEYVFGGTIENEYFAPAGDYRMAVSTWDQYNHVYIIREFIVTVNNAGFNPTDVTPPWLNITPVSVVMQLPYAYVAAGFNGFHVFNVENPSDIQWVSRINTGGYSADIAVDGNYAYVAEQDGGLKIIDISQPYNPGVVNVITTQSLVNSVKVRDGYAYVGTGDYFYVFDVQNPQSPVALQAIDNQNCMGWKVEINRNNAYLLSSNFYDELILSIYDIDPPASTWEISRLNLGETMPNDIAIFSGYAYIATTSVIDVVDISPPQTPSLFSQFSVNGMPNTCHVVGAYAYIATSDGVDVVDISTPGSETIINSMVVSGYPTDAFVTNTLGMIATANSLYTFDASSPGNETFFGYRPMIGGNIWSLETYGSNLYYTGDVQGIEMYSIYNQESPEFIKILQDNDRSGGLFADGGYLYRTGMSGFSIIDVSPVESAYVVKTLSPPNSYRGVCVRDGYAYVADEYSGLRIIDIDPPESAYIVKTVDTPGDAMNVDVFNGYAYVADLSGGVQIMDVDPPASASIVKNISTVAAEDVHFQYGYVYVADYTGGLVIVNVFTPESAYIVNTVPVNDEAWAIDITDDYAFIAADANGLQIFDINPPTEASWVSTIDTGNLTHCVRVSGNYVYAGDWLTGLRIIKLY